MAHVGRHGDDRRLLAVSQYQEWSRSADPGITTQVAALITFLLGVLALAPGIPLLVSDRYLLIVASAGVVMGLLSFKKPLPQAVARISDDDLYATAKFVVLAVVVLPLLPNRTYGPFNVVNPFHVALMVVLIAGRKASLSAKRGEGGMVLTLHASNEHIPSVRGQWSWGKNGF